MALLTPPALASHDELSVSGRTSFVRDGTTYKVRLYVDKGQLAIALARVRNPDGPGGLRSVQRSDYSFWTDRQTLNETPDDGITIRTGDSIAPWGHIRMSFTPRGEPEPRKPCDAYERQPGRLDGRMRLRTRSGFGMVELARLRATLTRFVGADSGCQVPPPPPVSPVPMCSRSATTLDVRDRRTDTTAISRPRKRGRVRFFTYVGRRLPTEHRDTEGSLERQIEALVPRRHLQVAPDLGVAVARGARGIDVRGRLRFTAKRPLRRRVDHCSWSEEQVVRMRRGTVTGTLRFDVFAGRDQEFAGRRVPTYLRHTRNRDIE